MKVLHQLLGLAERRHDDGAAAGALLHHGLPAGGDEKRWRRTKRMESRRGGGGVGTLRGVGVEVPSICFSVPYERFRYILRSLYPAQ